MVLVRSLLRRLRRVRSRHAVPILAVLGLALGALGGGQLPGLAAGGPEPWPDGRVTYFDASGSGTAIAAAAARWNRSGARVRIVRVDDRRKADVVFVVDRQGLRSDCGESCLALASAIGRPSDGRATVRLHPDIAGAPTRLGVWVAMHELGHILGLSHRDGRCSLMNAHAYDDSCSFVGGIAVDGPVSCGPASDDVAAAARLYGRDASSRPCR
jgi:Matrixin